MRSTKLLIALVALFGAALEARPAAAVGGAGRAVVIGALPDMFFPAGQTTTKEVAFQFVVPRGVAEDEGYTTVVARSTVPGVAVEAVYNLREYVFPPAFAMIGPHATFGVVKNVRFGVKVLSTAAEGTGAIEIFMNDSEDGATDDTVKLIGRINLHITNSPWSTWLQVTADPSNHQGEMVRLEHPRLNWRPDARLFVTQVRGSAPNPHPISVHYSVLDGRWYVANADRASIPLGARFNVRIDGAAAYVHRATSENTTGHATYIDDPVANENPYALLFVTQHWDYGHNPRNVSAFYEWGRRRWAIFNQDENSSILGTSFVVRVVGLREPSQVTVQAGNAVGDTATIENAESSWHRADAQLIVSPNWAEYGTGNDNPIGLRWNGSRWTIVNENGASMAAHAGFNVWRAVPPL